jgi:hypothetical protein
MDTVDIEVLDEGTQGAIDVRLRDVTLRNMIVHRYDPNAIDILTQSEGCNDRCTTHTDVEGQNRSPGRYAADVVSQGAAIGYWQRSPDYGGDFFKSWHG